MTPIDIYPITKFTYDEKQDIFLCPQGKELAYWGIHKHSKQHVYRARRKGCFTCPVKSECTKDKARSVSYHIYEDALQRTRELSKTKGYYLSQRMRKKIEELFGEAKEFMGFRRARFRRRKWIKEQVLMTATVQNIKRMVKMLSRGGSRNALSGNGSLLDCCKIYINSFLFCLRQGDAFIGRHAL